MKILQLIQKPQFRGAEMFASQLCNHLAETGHEVLLVSLLHGNVQLPHPGKNVLLSRPLRNRLFDYEGWKLLSEQILAFQPDVIQANAGDTLKYAVLSKLFFRWRAPIVFRNASIISSYLKSPLVKWWNSLLFRQVAHVISVSKASCQDFIRLFPFMRSRVTVIPIGLELDPLPRPVETTKPYLLHVGGFTFEKNHERLLHIYMQVQQSSPELELWLVGDGPLRDLTEQQVKAMGLDKVKFLGFRQDVFAVMQSAKALLQPSIIEGLPGVILEAMYCRTPVVAYDVGGISEVVKNNKTGWLVKQGDEDGFVKAVGKVLEGKDLDRITSNAYELMVKEYDNRVIAKRFVDVYKSLLVVSS